MRLSYNSIYTVTLAIVCTVTAVFADVDVDGITLSDDSITVTLSASGVPQPTFKFTNEDKNLYTYFQGKKTKPDTLTAVLPDTYKLKLENGVETVFAPTTTTNGISITSTAGTNKFDGATKHTLTAAPALSGAVLKLTYQDGTNPKTASLTLPTALSDLLAFKVFQGKVTTSDLPAGSYIFTSGFTNHVINVHVVSATDAVLLIFKENDGFVKKAWNYAGRPILFTAMTAAFSTTMAFVVQKFDPEMYALGGGFYGALIGQDAAEANSQETLSMADGETGGSDDISAPGPDGRPRPARSTSTPTDSMSDNGGNAEMNTDNADSDEVTEKTDARAAALVTLSAVALALLI